MKPPSTRNPERGGTLLIVMWCILVMVVVLMTVAGPAQDEMLAISGRIARERARQIAHMGLTLAQHPLVKPGDPILFQDLGNFESLEVSISSEESRLNVNIWLAEDRQPVLIRMFRMWGLERGAAEAIVDTLADWIDPDALRHPQGAEAGDYPQSNRPFNRPFVSLDELRLVKGFELVERVRPDWRTRLTVKGQGSLDLMAAPADLIEAVTGSTAPSVALWVRDRWGRDGIRHTEDDPVDTTVEQALQTIGVPAATVVTAGYYTIDGPTKRYESLGVKGEYGCIVSLIAGGGSGGNGGGQTIYGIEEQDGTLETILQSRGHFE